MKTTALIMAGGRGERFWPRSRKNMPKQFISLTGDGKTMIQHTVERIKDIVDYEDIFIATGELYREIVKEQLPMLPEQNIICEPIGRNTAPCIALGAAHIQKKYDDATMIVLPSDHIIKYTSIFHNTLKTAIDVAQNGNNMVTLGITPSYPETGYGYIQFENKDSAKAFYSVKRFVEKPDLETAQKYLDSEEYLWNSGMFVWKLSSVMGNIEKLMPQLFGGIQKIENAIGTKDYESVLKTEFEEFESVSIDYGIMEKADNIYTIPCTFGWDDVGSWLAVERIQKKNEFGNVINGEVVAVNTTNTIIQGGKKLIAAVGVSDIIIVESDDAILVCDKQHASEIKKVLENLKICDKTEYL